MDEKEIILIHWIGGDSVSREDPNPPSRSGVSSVEVDALACDMVLVKTIGRLKSCLLKDKSLPVETGDAPG